MRRITARLPRHITRFTGTREEQLELQHLKNVTIYDFKLGNLLFNAIKAEKKAKEINERAKIDFENIPF